MKDLIHSRITASEAQTLYLHHVEYAQMKQIYSRIREAAQVGRANITVSGLYAEPDNIIFRTLRYDGYKVTHVRSSLGHISEHVISWEKVVTPAEEAMGLSPKDAHLLKETLTGI